MQQLGELFNLTGRVAVVSGASRGIGRAVAELLASAGAQLVLTSRKREACEAVAADIVAAGGRARAAQCHIGEPAQIEALFGDIEATEGRVDILVNNAATNPYFGHIIDTDYGALQKTLDVNIRGYFLMSQRAAKLMHAQQIGRAHV